jgi:hypothetical protein
MRGTLEEDDKGKDEAQKPVAGAAEPMRPKDKYGLVLTLAVFLYLCPCGIACFFVSSLAPISPRTAKDIDEEFRRKFMRRFCGWEDAVKTASEVLIDEMRTLLERPP